MATERVTTQDIAEAAGVTSGTVSRALRGDPLVNAKTRQRIRDIADRMNYHPNLSARALRTGRSGTLALACSTGPWILSHPYFAALNAGFITAAAEEGVRVTVFVPPAAVVGPVEVTNQAWPLEMHNGLVDGCLIYQSHRLSFESIRYLRDSKLAVVLMNVDQEREGFSQLLSDAQSRIRESVLWARELGARRVGVLGLSERMEAANSALIKGCDSPPRGVKTLFQAIRHHHPDDQAAVDAAILALAAEKMDAYVFNSTVHVLRFRHFQKMGKVPQGPPLFYHKAQGDLVTLSGVHYMESDLSAAGRLAYGLMKQVLEGKTVPFARMEWRRAPAADI